MGHQLSFLRPPGSSDWHPSVPCPRTQAKVGGGMQFRVLGIAQARKTFEGAAFMSPALTTAKMQTRSPEAQAVLRTALNGSFFTADYLAKRSPDESSLCSFLSSRGQPCPSPLALPILWKLPTPYDGRTNPTGFGVLAMPAIIPTHAWMPTPSRGCSVSVEHAKKSQMIPWPLWMARRHGGTRFALFHRWVMPWPDKPKPVC